MENEQPISQGDPPKPSTSQQVQQQNRGSAPPSSQKSLLQSYFGTAKYRSTEE